MRENKWTKTSWKKYKAQQQPLWPDNRLYNDVIAELKLLPALVFSGETRKLINELSEVNKGKKFILQAGNCAESFMDCRGPKIHNFIRILLQMAFVINSRTNKNIIKIGRIAGQYAKPRSSNYENINNQNLSSYRGDNVNDIETTMNARTPNPARLKEGYYRSAATLNLIRAFIQGGYNDIQNITNWEQHFFEKEIANYLKYKKFAKDITKSFKNISADSISNNHEDQIYTSHEGLLLDYEEAFTRLDTTFKGYYDTTAHFLWIGERTRQLNGAHVEFFRGVGNPIGVKVGPDHLPDDILKLTKKLNPRNIDGKITIIARLGKKTIEDKLPNLIKKLKNSNRNVIWVSDPMHGNTFTYKSFKVRAFNDITEELRLFFKICKEEGVIPGGAHLEITDENVTECIGGLKGLRLKNVDKNYVSNVDPRLNAAQALELAFILGELINKSQNNH